MMSRKPSPPAELRRPAAPPPRTARELPERAARAKRALIGLGAAGAVLAAGLALAQPERPAKPDRPPPAQPPPQTKAASQPDEPPSDPPPPSQPPRPPEQPPPAQPPSPREPPRVAPPKPPPAHPPQQRFVLSPRSLLYVRVYSGGGLLSFLSHDHVISTEAANGELWLVPSQPDRCRGSLQMPVGALVVDEPALRERLGIDGMLDEEDRKTVKEHMLSPAQLWQARFPTLRAEVSACRSANRAEHFTADLTLSIRGRQHRARGALAFQLQGGKLTSRGALRLRHADFGMEPYEALGGSLRNDETLDFGWALTATLAASGGSPAGKSQPDGDKR